MQIRKGGSWRTPTSAKAFVNGSWQTLTNGKCYKSGRWRDVCNFATAVTPPAVPPPSPSPMSVTVSPSSLLGESTFGAIVTNTTTATPIGGRSPYTYLWSIVSSDGHAFAIPSSTNATTPVSVTGLLPGLSATCTIHCVVNDSTGLTATSPNVTALMIRDTAPISGGFTP